VLCCRLVGSIYCGEAEMIGEQLFLQLERAIRALRRAGVERSEVDSAVTDVFLEEDLEFQKTAERRNFVRR
jgi:hypothetical protein